MRRKLSNVLELVNGCIQESLSIVSSDFIAFKEPQYVCVCVCVLVIPPRI
jgi:hypothetical protein